LENILFNEIDEDKAVLFLYEQIDNLFNGKFDIKDFALSKTLKNVSKYKYPLNNPHVNVTMKMQKRDPANVPNTGERVPYVYVYDVVKNNMKNAKTSNLVEHPMYIEKDNLKIDYLHYLTNSIKKPCMDILELCVDKNNYPDVTSMFDEMIKECEKKRKNDFNIFQIFSKNDVYENNKYKSKIKKCFGKYFILLEKKTKKISKQ
jgi:DNA polymerase elongation subunit (family B)